MPKFKTDVNSFGVYRVYKSGEPTYTPDDNFHVDSFHVDSVANGPNFIKDQRSEPKPTWASPFGTDFMQSDPLDNTKPKNTRLPYLPFQNMSIFRLMGWFYDSSLMKSLGTLNNLVHQVLLAPDFDPNELVDFDAAKEAKCLDNFDPSLAEESNSGSKQLNDGWIESSVPISLPNIGVSHLSEAAAPVFHVKGFSYCKPLEVIKAAY